MSALVRWAGLASALALAGCGERAGEPSAEQARGGLEPARLLQALAARPKTAPVGDAELDRFRERLARVWGEHEIELDRLDARAWSEADAKAGAVRLTAAEAHVRKVAGRAVDAWVCLTSCPQDPARAAAHAADYLTPVEGPGFDVVALEGDGVQTFESTWDDASAPTTAWRHGALVVRALGLDREQLALLHEALQVGGLYGEVAARDLALGKRRGSGVPAPAPAPRSELTPFVGRWKGAAEDSAMDITLHPDGTFQAQIADRARRAAGAGTWALDGTGIVLEVTHEDGKPVRRPDRAFGALEHGALLLREKRGDRPLMELRRVP